jgi:hypothetical protein
LGEFGRKAIPIASAVVADIEAEWTAHLGAQRMGQIRDALTRLREITDPYAERKTNSQQVDLGRDRHVSPDQRKACPCLQCLGCTASRTPYASRQTRAGDQAEPSPCASH